MNLKVTLALRLCVLLGFSAVFSLSAAPTPLANQVVLIDVAGEVEFSDAGSQRWNRVYETNRVFHVGDRGRTGPRSRATLQLSDLSFLRLGERTEFVVEPTTDEKQSVVMGFLRGFAWIFHRDRTRSALFKTKSATAATRGTEFALAVDEQGGLQLTVLEGEAELTNGSGSVLLAPHEQGVASPGLAPRKTSMLEFATAIQWCLYYPGVLDPQELQFAPDDEQALAASLSAFRGGDLLRALSEYPAGRVPSAASEHLYLAALLLSVGLVEPAQAELDRIGDRETRERDLGAALRSLIGTIKGSSRGQAESAQAFSTQESATGQLAASYAWQGQGKLREALTAARVAVGISPSFGLGWSRVAELEFSHGRIGRAREALDRSLALAPRNAQAVALSAFLLAADGHVTRAEQVFSDAITLDGALANAWLGRGLCRIRRGQFSEGRRDLEIAVAIEPNRALLRSYLGKAWSLVGDNARTGHELAMAKQLDPNDPTSWLYSALLLQQQNRINEAVQELEQSVALNDNRRVYRSALLLDQDRAVRGANLANIYRDAGMNGVSVREAARAVSADYANYSAHLFLANSYQELRDPRQFELRYETAWFNEYLLANLLAPVGAGTLAPAVSAQEFSRLFERNRLGVVSYTEYSSRGDWVQSSAQYGTLDNSAYALEADYRVNHGQRRNNDLEQLTLSLKWKQQLSLNDSVYLQAIYYDAEGGDLAQVYHSRNPAFFRGRFRFHEKQEPLLTLGYHHQWSPQQHTLALAGRLHDRLDVVDPAQPVLLVAKDFADAIEGTLLTSAEQRYRSELEIYGAELQHLAEFQPWTVIGGARYQFGQFDTVNLEQNLASQAQALPTPLRQTIRPDLHRVTGYGYAHWQIADPFKLFGGLSYDYLEYPDNYRFGPVRDGEQHRQKWSPKAGFSWQPSSPMTLRAAYTRSLGGVSLEQSERLEPSQVAGFNQAWRSVIPESAAGSLAGAAISSGSAEWDYHLPSRTYLSVRGDVLRSDGVRRIGVFDLRFFAEPSTTLERLSYEERALTLTANQLVGDAWALGTDYTLSNAKLKTRLPQIPEGVPHLVAPYQLRPHQDLESTLHRVGAFVVFNHPTGIFARAEALWFAQGNQGYAPARPGDEYWQFNVFAGYRLPRRRAEVRFGLLNLADQNYRLNPLNLTTELPRRRTFTASLKLSF